MNENDPTPKTRTYWIGAYVVYPLMVAVGGVLLSRAGSASLIAVASALLVGAFVLSACLGSYCRRCGDQLLPRLMRLLILPIAIITALGFRASELHAGQYLALFLICVSFVGFSLAWQLSAPAASATA